MSGQNSSPVTSGTVLAIGGAGSGKGYGLNAIEVRESTGGVGWQWRKLTDDEKQFLIDALNGRPWAGRPSREKIALVLLGRRGFGFYSDPMEGGQDAYDITQDALADADAILAALPSTPSPNSPEQDSALAELQSQSGTNRSLSEGTPREGAPSTPSAPGGSKPIAWRWRYDSEKMWRYRSCRPPFADETGVTCEPLYAFASTEGAAPTASAPDASTPAPRPHE